MQSFSEFTKLVPEYKIEDSKKLADEIYEKTSINYNEIKNVFNRQKGQIDEIIFTVDLNTKRSDKLKSFLTEKFGSHFQDLVLDKKSVKIPYFIYESSKQEKKQKKRKTKYISLLMLLVIVFTHMMYLIVDRVLKEN